MRVQCGHQKFLVAFRNEKLIVDATAKGTFLGMSAYLKISVNPCCNFCIAHHYRKINKGRRADSCEAVEGIDSGSKGLLHHSDASRL
jgi:hypothetical protein